MEKHEHSQNYPRWLRWLMVVKRAQDVYSPKEGGVYGDITGI